MGVRMNPDWRDRGCPRQLRSLRSAAAASVRSRADEGTGSSRLAPESAPVWHATAPGFATVTLQTMRSSYSRLIRLCCGLAITASCGRANVERTVLLECPSPGGRAIAVFWTETAGLIAVGSVDYWLSVMPHRASVDELAATPSALVWHARRARQVHLRWEDDDRLHVGYPGSGTVNVLQRGPITLQNRSSATSTGLNVSYEALTSSTDGLLAGGDRCEHTTPRTP